ncbi:universal stress protein [Azospirillum sp. ST 5-10]|uniref:universal stress protein n=1 Tax=unclassified Azospirillum TaxID=2630922 RepID=UPI003F4A2C65
MKRLLVASDLSARSDRAVAQALFLARRFDAPVTVLHVVDDELPSAIFTAARKTALAYLRAAAGPQPHGGSARVEVRAVGGLDFQAIVAAADAEDAALVVLGAHRRNLLKDVLTGTTVERVVRNTTRPVLVVKRREPGEYPCTVAAVDLVEEAAEVVRLARRMAAGRTLYLLHVLGDAAALPGRLSGGAGEGKARHRAAMEERCRDCLRTIAGRAGLRDGDYLPMVEWSAAAPRLHDVLRALPAELCVVGTRTHAKGAVERLVLGSVAEEVLRDAECDVVALPLSGHTPLPGSEPLTALG